MDISNNALLSALGASEGFSHQRGNGPGAGFCCSAGNSAGPGSQAAFNFTDPVFTSQQLKEKWQGGFKGVMFGSGSQASGSQGHGMEQTGRCSTFSNAASSAVSQLNQGSAHAEMKDGRVAFENDNYGISISDTGEIKIHNKSTDENYRIWGDPHVDVDGKRAFDFKGDTTFVLDDGTKISVETTPWKGGHNGQTIASKVSIIDGNSSYGLYVTGVDDNQRGDLAFEEVPNFGHFLDAMVDDGNYVHENPVGKGFIAVGKDGWAEVDQSVMDFIENAPDRLSGGDDLFAHNGSMPNNPLTDFLQGDPVRSSLSDLASFLQPCQAGCEQNSILKSVLSAIESLLSLVAQQARPFGHLSGLSEIQTQGSYGIAGGNNPFQFSLNFYRA